MIVPAGTTEVRYFYHQDALGSIVALSKFDNGSASFVEGYSYSAFGETTVTLNGSTGNPYMFTGREYQPETGLYYYRARFYKPDIGRFLQPDPIGYDDGPNMYAYCTNNPLVFVDPFGLCKERGFGRRLWEGDYFGTQYGASSTDRWAERAVASKTWYGTAGNYFMGGLSALWTPETYKETTFTLASAYGASRSIAAREGRRVFWSGSEKAKTAAVEYAKANKARTLEMTKLGKQTESLTQGLDWLKARPSWVKASTKFARGASGEVHVFQADEVGLNSIWATEEYGVLMNNKNVTEIIFHVVGP